ncbi:hypothetical protein EZV62_017197 [Acer yangbiense]|uniref:Uncharacterized protein n=1 Tax=Acer yangbiense TaxID=1000413 RepID=A0A5C7HFV3_9ROSI|nr:hypothetical protein EZV62_017197 [Acer yangbiense]
MELEFYHKKMEVELRNFMILWFIVLLSLCYCYAFGNKISKGIKRLLFVLPIVVLFVYLPLDLYSFHLNIFTSFFIGFLGNFKLLLFAFGKCPLSSNPSISLAVFLAVASLPIKLQQNPPPNGQNKDHPSPNKKPNNGSPILVYAIKGPILAMVTFFAIYTVHQPAKKMFTRVLGSRWATPSAIVATFFVSGLLNDSRANVLSFGARKTHGGDDMFLSPSWNVGSC